LFTTAETAAIAVAAALSGVMFGVARWLPFVTFASLGILLTLALPALWRTMPGRVADRGSGSPGDTGGPAAEAAEALTAGALPAVPPA
jgi:hypothetical protein